MSSSPVTLVRCGAFGLVLNSLCLAAPAKAVDTGQDLSAALATAFDGSRAVQPVFVRPAVRDLFAPRLLVQSAQQVASQSEDVPSNHPQAAPGFSRISAATALSELFISRAEAAGEPVRGGVALAPEAATPTTEERGLVASGTPAELTAAKSVVLDFETGIKTTHFTGGVVSEEPFDPASLRYLVGRSPESNEPSREQLAESDAPRRRNHDAPAPNSEARDQRAVTFARQDITQWMQAEAQPATTGSVGAVRPEDVLGRGLGAWTEKGVKTASGERFDPDGLTAGHRTLPFGTRVRVVNRVNQRSVVVRINDRGSPRSKFVIDLSRGSARALGIDGIAPVTLVKVN